MLRQYMRRVLALLYPRNFVRFVGFSMKSAINYPSYLYFKLTHPEVRINGWIARHFQYSKPIIDFCHACHHKMLLEHCPLDENSVVIDVGAFDGTWAEKLLANYQVRMHLFEPLPSAYATLQEKFAARPEIRLYPYGLADADSTASLSESGMGSSIYQDSPSYFAKPKTVTVPLRDMEAAFRELGLAEADLININIEGGEYPLLKFMLDRRLTRRFKYIRIQFHEWISGSHEMRAEIVKGLAATHDVEWSYPFVWESWRRKAEAS